MFSVLAGVAIAALSVVVFWEIRDMKEWFMSLQETVDLFASVVLDAGVELKDSFGKISAEIQGLKDQIAALGSPVVESVDFSGLEAAVASVQEVAASFDALEPPVVVEPVPVDPEAVPAPVDPVVEVPVEEAQAAE